MFSVIVVVYEYSVVGVVYEYVVVVQKLNTEASLCHCTA